MRSSLTPSYRASLLGKVSTKLIRKPRPLSQASRSWRKAPRRLRPIIKSSSNLRALGSFLPSRSPKCFLPMLFLFLSPVSCKILFQNVSQPSANEIRSCLTITKPPGPWPKPPLHPWHPVSQDDLRASVTSEDISEQLYKWRNSFVIFSRDQEKKMLRTRKWLVGRWPGHWNLNVERFI